MKEEFLKRPRMSRIYWNGKFLDYPLDGMDVDQEARPARARPLRPLLPVGAGQAQGQRGELRAVGLQPLRQAALPPLLQDLHREGLGRPDHRAARRVGRAADQGPLLLLRRQGRLLRQQRQQDQVADQRVPLPALRPRPDVGDDGRRDHRRAAARCASTRPSKLEVRDGRIVAIEAGGERIEPSRRDLLAAAARHRRPGRRRRRRRGPGRPQGLRYRDFLTVALVIDGEDLFPDNWIYIHEPDVRVGRIQNYRSWSPWMVPGRVQGLRRPRVLLLPGRRPVGDGRRRAGRARQGRARASSASSRREKVERGFVTRVPLAYPMYDADYARARRRDPRLAGDDRQPAAGRAQRPAPVQQLRPLDAHRDPRGGQRRSTGARHDLWEVNAESVYHEEGAKEEHPYRRAPETPSMREPLVSEG